MRKCNSTNFEEWTLTSRCQLKLGKMCLDVDSKNNVKVLRCTRKVPINPWQYSYQHRTFVSNGNKCLQIDVTKVGLMVNTCDSDLTEQRWMFTGVQDSTLDHVMTACLNTNH